MSIFKVILLIVHTAQISNVKEKAERCLLKTLEKYLEIKST